VRARARISSIPRHIAVRWFKIVTFADAMVLLFLVDRVAKGSRKRRTSKCNHWSMSSDSRTRCALSNSNCSSAIFRLRQARGGKEGSIDWASTPSGTNAASFGLSNWKRLSAWSWLLSAVSRTLALHSLSRTARVLTRTVRGHEKQPRIPGISISPSFSNFMLRTSLLSSREGNR
jgi:hypothetical protein